MNWTSSLFLVNSICAFFNKNRHRQMLAVIVLFTSVSAQSFVSYFPSDSVYLGYVYGRAIVKDETSGFPRWAEYNEQGGHTEFFPGLSQASRAKVVSAISLNNDYTRLADFKTRYDNQYELLSADQYDPTSFQTQDGTPISKLPTLSSGQYAIAIPAKSKRFNTNGNYIETLIFTFDVIKHPSIASDTFTVLVGEDGLFMKESDLRIGYLTAFILDENGEVAASTEYDGYEGLQARLALKTVLNPVSGVRVTGSNGMTMDQEAYTDIEGSYRLQMRFGCPGGFFQTTTYLDAHLNYGMFNPRGTSSMPYWLTFPAIDNCIGYFDPYTGVSSSNITATRISFQVAISVLTGTATLWNADISASEPTAYHAEQSTNDLIMIATDYDGDHLKDGTVQGTVDEATNLFTADPGGNLYGVYLSASLRDDGQPNFTRIMDIKANTTAQGLVSTIHKDDLRNTDIYAFRESTGELITERIGMPEQKLRVIGAVGEGLTENNQFSYSFAIRSPEDMLSQHSKRHDGWEDWQADNKINPKLHSRQSDFIRTGEQIRIVAINRATGYIGTALTTLSETKDGGDLTVFVDNLLLKAPNLKVWATRRYQPQGALKNADKVRNTISNEGAATTDDYLIEIHTHWMDENGLPLPDHLKDRGYTGRLVRVASNAADPYQTRVTEFAINPGRHLQVIKFGEGEKDGEAGKFHYYLQVNGKSDAETNDFSPGSHTGVLRHRPSLYVPIKVPLYNEQQTKDNTLAQKMAEAASGNADGEDFEEEALFDWVYRPELSFSVVDLEVQGILRETESADGSAVSVNIIKDDIPVISSSDDLIKVLFELSQSEFDRITPLDGEQEYILAFGEEEVSIKLVAHANEDKQITFSNLEHLAEIEPEDYLSLRLYLNQDSQNVLWEFAFETVALTPNPEGVEEIIVSADDNELHFNLLYLGYESKDPAEQGVKRVSWKTDGYVGSFSPSVESAQEGSFSTKLTTSRIAGSEATLYAVTDESAGSSKIYGPKIKVIAGKPASIEADVSGTTAIGGIDEITLDITVKDQFGQKVEDGTSVGISYIKHLNVDYVGSTVDGKVQAIITGGSYPGDIELAIQAGDISYSQIVSVDDVNLAINMPPSLMPRSKATVFVTANSPGHDLEGMVVTLRTSKGSLEEHEVTLKNGTAQTTIAAESIQGAGLLTAGLEDLVFKEQPFAVEYSAVLVGLNESVLVGDQATDGSVSIDKGDGTTFEAPYVVSTEMTLSGTAGTTETISIGSLENPPIEPLLYYSLNRVYSDNVVGDAYGVINGQNTSAVENPESAEGFRGSYSFTGGAKVTVPQHVALQKNNNLGFGLKVKPNASGTIVDYSATSQKLMLSTANRFQYQVTTTDGVYTVESNAVDLNSWYSVGVRFQNGELALEVNGERFTTSATGNLITSNEGSSAVTLGDSFTGLMNNFKVIDWDYPLLATLPNGKFEMDVTFSSAIETIAIASTNKIGTRPMGYLAANGLAGAFPHAYANDRLNGWIGEIMHQGQAVKFAVVETSKIVWDTTSAFSHGLLLGHTDTTAGIIGDIVLGFIPLGDLRDVALQNYYEAHKTLDADGNLIYDETTLYLSYVGLGADGLMFVAPGVGLAVNGAVAGTKTVMKAIDAFPAKKVLSGKFKEMAEAARDGDWTRFQAKAEIMLPIMELFAAVAIDEDLRNLLASAIRNTTDLDNWTKYLAGFAGQADAVAHLSPLPNGLFDEAYAATSGFKIILRKFADFANERNITNPGEKLADTITAFNKSIDNGWEAAEKAYNEKAILALTNVAHLGGVDLANILKDFNSKRLRRSVEDFMTDLSDIKMDDLPSQAKEGLQTIIKEMSHTNPNKAKGAVHHISLVADYQRKNIDILKIELRETVTIGGKALRDRRYDVIVDIGGVLTKIEAKSWISSGISANTKSYLLGKAVKNADGVTEYTDKGAQLLMDLMSYSQNGFKGHKWVFHKDMVGKEAVFRSEIFKNLRDNSELRSRLMGHLNKSKKELKVWIKDLEDNFNDFYEVIQ